MARDLLVCGLDEEDWNGVKDVLKKHGCTLSDQLQLQVEDDAVWCAASLPSLAAADACSSSLKERFGHLMMYIDTDWHAFGKTKATARTKLIQLTERLGCRSQPHAVQPCEALSLARHAPDVLAAVELAGGVQALAAADPDAAACLCRGLTQAVCDAGRLCWLASDMHCRVEDTFAVLAPAEVRAAAAGLRKGAPGSPHHAYLAARLARVFLHMNDDGKGLDGHAENQMEITAASQGFGADCLELLRAIPDALAEWSAGVSRLLQQLQLPDGWERDGHLYRTGCQLRDDGHWLPGAATELLECMKGSESCSAVDELQLLDTLGQLVQQVVISMQLDDSAAAARLWPPELSGITAAPCIAQLHLAFGGLAAASVRTPAYIAGLSAMRAAIVRALCTVLDHLAVPRHIGLLLHLSLMAMLALLDASGSLENISTLMSALARVQHLATSWITHPLPEVPERRPAVEILPPDGAAVYLLPFADQVALLMDINADHLAAAVRYVISNSQHHATTSCIFECGAVSALAAALQATPASRCRNVRSLLSKSLLIHEPGYCLAPGLFHAANALGLATQYANAAAAVAKPWAADAVAALVGSSLGTFQLAHAEAAAQHELASMTPVSEQPEHCRPRAMRVHAIEVLACINEGMVPLVARALAKQGLIGPLLQALPWRATPSELAADMATWQTTLRGTWDVGQLVAAILAADVPARKAVLRDGSWRAAVQRVRELQPPLPLAAQWVERWEALLHKVAAVLGRGGGGSCQRGGGSASDADAAAIAAAERAMQELLAEEQRADTRSQHSKPASKRARKKAAKQQAAAAGPSMQLASPAAQSATMDSCSVQEEGISRRSTPAPNPSQPDAASEEMVKAGGTHDSVDAACLPQQPAASTGHPAAGADWWRCPLSGKAMRDPVLCGIGGHSFERAALEQWLAANPGVDPLNQQPLPPEASTLLPNHALRNMIQQLYLG